MSGTINHDQATADAEQADDGKFFFSLQADEGGVTELKFRKDGQKLFGVVLFGLEYINQSFDTPFPCVGDFCRHLGGMADEIEAIYKQQQEQANGQANEAANDAGPEAPEAA